MSLAKMNTMAFVAILLMGGCTARTSSSSSTSDVSSSPTSPIPPIPTATDFGIAFASCHGSIAAGQLPPGLGPEPLFPSWQGFELGAPQVTYDFVTCERISFGEFERGPTSLMLEYHDAGSPPTQACQGGRELVTYLYNSYWEDPELGEAFGKQTGAPVSIATFAELSDVPLAGLRTFRVSMAGNLVAEWTVPISDTAPEPAGTFLDRLAWRVADGVGFLNVTRQASHAPDQIPAATGTFGPPTLWNAYMGIQMAGLADVPDPWMFTNAAFSFFEDQYCKVPSLGPSGATANATNSTTATP